MVVLIFFAVLIIVILFQLDGQAASIAGIDHKPDTPVRFNANLSGRGIALILSDGNRYVVEKQSPVLFCSHPIGKRTLLQWRVFR